MHLLSSFHTELRGNLFVNYAGSFSLCWKQNISDNNAKNNRMYGGILQILIEQEETFTERLIGRVIFNTESSVVSEVLILLNYCFELPLTTAGVYTVTQTQRLFEGSDSLSLEL